MPEHVENARTDDPTFQQEQAHLSELYAKLVEFRDELTAELEATHAESVKDLLEMSEEVNVDVLDLDDPNYDDLAEAAASIEALNSIIDAYNQHH